MDSLFRFITLFLLVIASSPLNAAAEKIENPLLWKVEGKGKTSYLFGTIHKGVPAEDLPESVISALKASEIIALETDLHALDGSEIQKWIYLPEGMELSTFLSPQAWARLVKEFSGKTSEEALKKLQPWWVSFQLLQMSLAGLELKGGMDLELLDLGKANGLEFRPLEHWRVGFMSLMAISPIWRLEQTLQSEDLAKEGAEAFLALIRDYRRGDLDNIFAVLNKEYNAIEVEAFVSQRNRTWVPVIEDMMAQKSAFIAVGGGHLAGEAGLVELLRARGHKVTRVK